MSTRKRLSLRAVARLRRLYHRLTDVVSGGQWVEQQTAMTTWGGIGQRLTDEINTARKLGYTVEVTATGETITLLAVKRIGGYERLRRFERENGEAP